MGLILGQFSSPLPEVQKEPVAYLYNGVRLPKLPEWDRGKYPYAVIALYNTSNNAGKYELILCQNILSYDGENVVQEKENNYLCYLTDNNTWNYINTYDFEEVVFIGDGEQTLIWTSSEIPNSTDGSVYMAATKPAPVYE